MAKKEVYICDSCGYEDDDSMEFQVVNVKIGATAEHNRIDIHLPDVCAVCRNKLEVQAKAILGINEQKEDLEDVPCVL